MISISIYEYPPAGLPEDVRAVWDELAPRLGRRVPGPEFEAYCTQVARLRNAQARISAEGLIVADAKGAPVPHPALDIERRASAEIRAFGGIWDPPTL